MSRWCLKSVEISGGFLGGLLLELPPGLTCVIGPRGSGKSTLAEAIRYAVAGAAGASKARLDLIQANLGSAALTVRTTAVGGEPSYTIRRVGREPATLVTSDGKAVASVDLERGTFLPLDAYASAEIEAIADETLGVKRRALLDELRADEMHRIGLSVGEKRRALDANADAVRAADRQIADLTEHVEALAGARARLTALPQPQSSESSAALTAAAKQRQANRREAEQVDTAIRALASLREQVGRLKDAANGVTVPGGESGAGGSANNELMSQVTAVISGAVATVEEGLRGAGDRIKRAEADLADLRTRLTAEHQAQDAAYAAIQADDHAASEAVRQRHEAEQAVAQLETTEADRVQARAALTRLRDERKALKGEYLLERERVSAVREEVAARLQADAGSKVRVRVLRNADSLGYRSALTEGLKGARVKNHDDILDCLMRLRPEQLAQIVSEQDAGEFEHQTSLGSERCRKILESFRANLDPLLLEIMGSDDRVGIELNVATSGAPNYKDAADLSRGQKCTALLPLLLARRESPLLIDQPEDNLDNHFIYETVVESIRQRKERRQMVFITHNANIPVLAEAELVVVLNSDGKAGYVEKAGTLDECRDQIVDLLEGGKEAFELRRRRYARVR